VTSAANPLSLLLVEPAFVLRRTVTVTARSMQLADVQEAMSVPAGLRMMHTTRFDGLLLAVPVNDESFSMLHDVREGRTMCAADVPIALMLDQCAPDDVRRLRSYHLHRILLKPYKVKSVLEVVASIGAHPVAA